MFADVVGFAKLTQENESLALELLKGLRRQIRPFFPKHNGRVIKTMGDAILVEFASALEATRCAFEIQRSIHESNETNPSERRLWFRIGIHLGEIISSKQDINGDSVNIASRIESIAEPGGICVTQQVYDQIRNKFEFPIVSVGIRELKNIQMPLQIYKIILPWGSKLQSLESSLDPRRIVVLPLANMISGPEEEYFADGMTEELISTISNINELSVISRTSAMKFKGGGKTAVEIGHELGAGTLLEGSVRKSEKKVRISVQLIDALRDRYLWTQTYERPLGDVFAIQSEIAEKVADALKIRIMPNAKAQLTRVPTTSTDAHSLYLRGRHHWHTRSEVELEMAIKCFNDAVKIDREYVLAFLGLADCYSILGVFGFKKPSLVYPKAKKFALKGLELDPNSAEAHASMGEILMHYEHDWKHANIELERALELNSNYSIARVWKSTYHAVLGDSESAIAEARLANELDPFSVAVMNELGKDLYYARKYDDSISQFRRSIEIEPESAYLHKGLAESYAQKFMLKESIKEAEKAASLSKSPLILASAGYVYAVSGKKKEAKEVLRKLDSLSKRRFVPSFGRATIYAGLGEKKASLRWLEKAYEERAFAIWFNVDPIFDLLQTEIGFQNLVKKMGLSISKY